MLNDTQPLEPRKNCKTGGIELVPHPAYSFDLVPSDYYLSRSMAHFLVVEALVMLII